MNPVWATVGAVYDRAFFLSEGDRPPLRKSGRSETAPTVVRSETDLERVADHSAAAVGTGCVHLEEQPGDGCSRIGRNEVRAAGVAVRREWTDAPGSVLRMVEDIVELSAEFDRFRFGNPRTLRQVHVEI